MRGEARFVPFSTRCAYGSPPHAWGSLSPERLQFADATERVVLVIARGTGGCKAFTLVPVTDAEDLREIKMFGPNHLNVAPSEDGKWTDFLLSAEDRQLLDRVTAEHFVPGFIDIRGQAADVQGQ